MKKQVLLLITLALLFMEGCSTTKNFKHTPVDEVEFSKSMEELKAQYPDIENYTRTMAWLSETPKKAELEALWGEPKTKKKWGEFILGIGFNALLLTTPYFTPLPLVLIYVLFPTPREEYVWHKGHYEIVAKGRNGALVKYEKRIHRWKWRMINAQETEVKTQ